MFINRLVPGETGGAARDFIDPNLDTQLSYVENRLGQRTWFLGDVFLATDIQMTFPLEAAVARAGLTDKYPGLHAFLQRTQARSTYRRALERGGPYQLMS